MEQLTWRWKLLFGGEAATYKVRAVIGRALDEYLRDQNKSVWCEKSVSTVDHLVSVTSAFPDARFINLHRHCLDVAASCIDIRRSPIPGRYGFEPYIERSTSNMVDGLVDYWVDKTTRQLQHQAANPKQCVSITYEALVRAPYETVGRVFTFLGMDWDPNLLDAVFTAAHQVGPGDSNIHYATKIDPGSVGTGLSSIRIADIDADRLQRMNALLETLGYEVVRPEGVGRRTQGAPSIPKRQRARSEDVNDLLKRVAAQLAGNRAAAHGTPASLRLVVEDVPNGQWVIDLRTLRVRQRGLSADMSLQLDGATLLNLADGELNSRKALRSGRIRLSEPRALDLLFFALFGRWPRQRADQ